MAMSLYPKYDALTYVVLRQKSGLWGISWYHRMFSATDEVSHKPSSL